MKVYVLTIYHNDVGANDEVFFEWEEIQGVTQSKEKADQWEEKEWVNRYHEFELD